MRTSLKSLCFVIGMLVIALHSFAQSGTLDSTFGTNGKVTIPDGSTSQSVAIQKDGKIVVAGYKFSSEPFITRTFLLYRLNVNGSIDSSFGTSGKIEFLPTSAHDCFVGDLKIQADNKILLGGTLFIIPGSDFVLARFNENGTFDSTFGSNGIVITNIKPGSEDVLLNLNFKGSDKILACGSGNGLAEMACYNLDGSLDQNFGNNGLIYDNYSLAIYAAKTFADEQFVTASSGSVSDVSDFLIIKYRSDGLVDSSFGNAGKTYVDFLGDGDDAKSIAITNSARILVGGYAFSVDKYYPVITRLLSDGTIDASFGNNGKMILDFGSNQTVTSIVTQYDDKILLVISSVYSGSEFIVRLLENGTLDSSFGIAGKVPINLSSWNGLLNYNLNCLALQPDNKIVITGGVYSTYRYQNEEPIYVNFVKNISVIEGNTGTTAAQFKITLSRPSAKDISVSYAPRNITAISGSDYIETSGRTRIKAGKTKGTIVINVIGDNVKEKTERFALLLENPYGAVLGTVDSVTCAIKNDDAGFAKASDVSDIKTPTIKVYPNPVSDVLTIDGLSYDTQTTISIINAEGKIIFVSSVNSNVFSHNVNKLAAGIYFLKIVSGDKSETVKFVKE